MSGFLSKCCGAYTSVKDACCPNCGDDLAGGEAQLAGAPQAALDIESSANNDEQRACFNATKRVETIKARAEVVTLAKSFVQMTKQNDPEGEAEFLKELVEAVEKLKELEEPQPKMSEMCWCAAKGEAPDAVCPIHD